MIIPIISTLIGAIAMITLSRRMSANPNYLLLQIITVGTMAMTYTVPLITYFQNKWNYRRDVIKREKSYQAYLDEQREMLQQMKNEIVIDWHQTHPESSFCLQWTLERNRCLWERIPQDRDFLKLRSGLGTVPSELNITVPKQEGIEKEPLIEKARDMTEKFISIAEAPVPLDLKKFRVVGLVGESKGLDDLARAIMAQTATHHSPDEVKIVSFYNDSKSQDWEIEYKIGEGDWQVKRFINKPGGE
ncbi:hypothetical protein [Cohnella panacarvi]|uniref:hypothetical protein n=1 Tax=Cohnella panacarvi TaxID=400776 RepID=UPI0012EB5EA5|nr:hypothetical protein [Cohnella panacarvi]